VLSDVHGECVILSDGHGECLVLGDGHGDGDCRGITVCDRAALIIDPGGNVLAVCDSVDGNVGLALGFGLRTRRALTIRKCAPLSHRGVIHIFDRHVAEYRELTGGAVWLASGVG
jgi:hypothetical protein